MKSFLKNTALIFVGLLLSFVIVEIILQIYNPFNFTIKAGSIVLPSNQEYRYKNYHLPGLDEEIIVSLNSLGLRGAEPPNDFEKYISIVAVGGSTTQCITITEGKTWTDILDTLLKKRYDNIWINNAGLDGHSTFGHVIMLRDYISNINPRMVLFLIGANDIERKDLSAFDAEQIRGTLFTDSFKGLIKSISSYSETTSLMLNMYRFIRAKSRGLVHHEINMELIRKETSLKEAEEILEENRTFYIPLYRSRVLRLINLTQEMGSDPILITQPSLFGMELEKSIQNNSSKIHVNDLLWQRLELYNDVLRDISLSEDVFLIDLAKDMPKSTGFFYDGFHFTNKGAQFVGNYIHDVLKPLIEKNYTFNNHQDRVN